jgi:hypothetical protein
MRQYLREHPAAFDPETIAILSDALDNAWNSVEANKRAYKLDGHAEGARQALARHLVDIATQGERDPQRLIDGALARLKA